MEQPEHPSFSTTKPLRGSARGKLLTRLVTARISEFHVCVLDDVLIEFNKRYSPPMAHSNAVNALRASPVLRRVAPGIYVGCAGDGPVLPAIRILNPLAYAIYRYLDHVYPGHVRTATIRESLSPYGVTRKPSPDQTYSALRFLEAQGLLVWDKAHARLNKMYLGRSEILGGGRATDVRLTAEALQALPAPDDNADRAYFDAIKERRGPEGDVLTALDEDGVSLVPGLYDPFD